MHPFSCVQLFGCTSHGKKFFRLPPHPPPLSKKAEYFLPPVGRQGCVARGCLAVDLRSGQQSASRDYRKLPWFAHLPTTQKSYKSYRSYKSYLVKFTVTTPAQTTVILGNKRLRHASKNVHGKHDGGPLAVIHL